MPVDAEAERIWPRENPEELVMAFDVGTTQSAVCIAHCVPGFAPKFRVVQKWPASPNNSKIPTVIVYDQQGQSVAFGAEVGEDPYSSDVFDGVLNLARWFKLHLHPAIMQPPPYSGQEGAEPPGTRARLGNLNESGSFEVPPLPPGVTVKQCYTDFLRYLYTHAKKWYIENDPDGQTIWQRLGDKSKICIAHPNGWGVQEQSVLASAVVDAGIMRASAKEERLFLVTEAEASVHFGVMHFSPVGDESAQAQSWLAEGCHFAVVDAGGSTVDTCVYKIHATSPKLVLHEARGSDCTQSGAIFVSRKMESILTEKLKDSKYGTPEYITILVDQFDIKTKLNFSDSEEIHSIKFGMNQDTDRNVGIAKGRLTLTGAEVESAFAPCVDTVIKSITSQIKGLDVTHILLVGGFGESPYLRRRVRSNFEKKGIRIVSGDEPTRKAVSEGAAIYYARRNVGARVTRYEFGLSTNRPYEPHLKVKRPIIVFESSKRYFAGGWTRIVGHGVPVETDQIYKESFWVNKKPQDSLIFSTTIISFNGANAADAYGGWSQDDNGKLLPGFTECCTVKADLSRELDFEIGLWFGSTSLKACVIWRNGDREERSEATILPAKFL